MTSFMWINIILKIVQRDFINHVQIGRINITICNVKLTHICEKKNSDRLYRFANNSHPKRVESEYHAFALS